MNAEPGEVLIQVHALHYTQPIGKEVRKNDFSILSLAQRVRNTKMKMYLKNQKKYLPTPKLQENLFREQSALLWKPNYCLAHTCTYIKLLKGTKT